MGTFNGVAGSPSTENAYSAEIWGDCPWEDLETKKKPGATFFDDFNRGVLDLASWDFTGNNSGTGAVVASDTGLCALTTGATATNYCYLAGGCGLTGTAKMDANTRVWFETRFKVSVIAATSYAVGLSIPSFATAAAIADTTGILSTTNGSYLMFAALNATPSQLDANYATASTATSMAMSGASGPYRTGTTRVQTMVADTFVKVGVRFNGSKLFYYVDGMLLNPSGVLYTATNFPDGVNLHAFYGIKTGASAAQVLTIDWTKIAYATAV